MKKILVEIDDELAKELAKQPNMSETVRQSLKFYIQHISTDTVEGMRDSYKIILSLLKEMDGKIDFLAGGSKPRRRLLPSLKPLNEDGSVKVPETRVTRAEEAA